MKNSIKTRLVKSFMLIIIITVLILEIVLSKAVKDYYYKSLEDLLTSQIEYSTDFYSRYFSSYTIEDIISDDIDIFLRHSDVQVQIISLEGKLLMDSIGVDIESSIRTPDVVKALDGEKGVWTGNVSYDIEPVMAVSIPLISKDESIGVIRFISSLKETDKVIGKIIILLAAVGIIVVTISGVVSIFLANSIVKPLIEVTEVAGKMADGQLKIRSHTALDDEIGRLSDTLNYMADEILKREQIKNDFISSISHELRTPLTSIKGWAITLQSGDMVEDELLTDGLKIIENESDRLSLMVEELLDFSRFISGRISLQKELFDIRNTLILFQKQCMPRAVENKIKFTLKIEEQIHMMIGDENRIKQVIINLVDNAFKFTGEGGEVILSAYRKDDWVVLEVEDNGVGIPKEDLPNVKEKFYKGKNSGSHTGLGLSICDEIIKLHDGKMEIESEINHGTIVRAILPYREEEI
ncbi:sensor histidine kinase [Wansuia hejianensis]|uniref:histidine kinase n=1 Tax=Wansuia hejianensis TaxID=2763667 RepID=A0A926IGG3_9FIRM|nr:HAMP domain-containing sensor histidine kinase [Wansuia hejianensis]MBC8589557.1 HAMP domain-containing histidine kinase [Wansuia hejianensis]